MRSFRVLLPYTYGRIKEHSGDNGVHQVIVAHGHEIDSSHKSHNASDKMYNNATFFAHVQVHISVTKWCIVGYEAVALWDLSGRSIRYAEAGHPFALCCVVRQRWCAFDLYIDSMGLTYWDLNKIATILQTTFSNIFSWLKMYIFIQI